MAAQSSNDGTAAGHRRGEVSGSSSRAENPFLDPAPSRRRSADDLENPFRGSTAASSQISLGLASGAASSNGDERRDLLASLPNRDHPSTWLNLNRPANYSDPFEDGEDLIAKPEPATIRRKPSLSDHIAHGRSSIERGVRRGSQAAVDAANTVLNHVEMGAEMGNPLGLQVNEIRRIAPGTVPGSGDWFDGRLSIEQYNDGRPSISEKERPVIVTRATDDPKDFLIQRVADHDDIDHMPRWKQWVYRSAPIWVVVSLVFYWLYFALRVRFTLAAQNAAHKIFGLAWAFIVVELFVAVPMILHRSWSILVWRGRRRPKLRLIGPSVPSVDVVITCCGEDDDLVMDTAKAACNVDYPIDRFRVMILDDGASAGLKAKVEDSLHHGWPNMHYFSRPKYPGVPHHFKAGNLNYALEQTKKLPGGAANFVACLDADMIPERDWLRALLPHMLQDEKCCMACPPQQFYNIPKDDPLCQSLDTFVHISEPTKDALGVAWCTGSGYIMRREALDGIGGFPYGSLAEDVCTSSMLLGAGWKTAYVHEPLQYGTVPEDLVSHLKQRTRWTIGTIQTALKLRFCLYGPLVTHMSFMQRASGFVYTISSLFVPFLVVSMFTVPIVLLDHGTMIPYATLNQLRWLIRLCFANMVMGRVNEWVVYLPSGYRCGQRDARGMTWMAPYHSIAVIQSFLLPKWLGGKIAVFTSTGSQASDLNERDPALRAPLHRRLWVTIVTCKAYLHLGYIILCLTAVGVSTWWCMIENHTARTQAMAWLTHAGWPPVLWVTCAVNCWAPIQYALTPPTVPDREELLDRDDKTGVAYPKESAKKTSASAVHWLHEVQYTLICCYTAVAFVLSFWI